MIFKKVKEVYNLRTDRFETKNLIADYPKKVGEIEKHIMEWNPSCKKSHSGGDYSNEFKPVGRWIGIDVKKENKK